MPQQFNALAAITKDECIFPNIYVLNDKSLQFQFQDLQCAVLVWCRVMLLSKPPCMCTICVYMHVYYICIM